MTSVRTEGIDLDGMLSFPVTPFAKDGGIDVAAFAQHLEVQLATEARAIFVACGTGEFTALTLDEYATVVRTAVEAAGGSVPVLAGIGGGSEMARVFRDVAADHGADGVLLLPPYLLSSTPAGLVAHIRRVASGSPLPIIVYQRANAVLDPSTAVDLLDLPEVIGIKDGIGDVAAMLRIVTAVRRSGHARAPGFQFFNGLPTAELGVQAYSAIGVSAYSSAVLGFAPAIASAFHAASSRGDGEGMTQLLHEFYLPFAALRDEIPGYAVSLVKAGARLAGLPVGGVRPPLIDPTDAHVQRLAEIIDAGERSAVEVNVRRVLAAR